MKLIQALIAVAAVAGLTACDRSAPKPQDTVAKAAERKDQALVRVIHALPQAPQADVYAGNDKTFSGVSFGTATTYKPVAEEQFTLALKPAGQPDGPALLEAKEGVDAGRRYTVLAMADRDGAGKLDVVTDEVEAPKSGKAMVRVIHAAPQAGSVDIFATGKKDDPVIDNVDYGSVASYHEVDPADLNVEVESKPSGPVTSKKRAAAITEKATFAPGKVYTVVVAPSDDPAQTVKIITVEDTNVAAPARAAESGDVSFGKEKAMQKEPESEGSYSITPDLDPLKDRPQGAPQAKAKK